MCWFISTGKALVLTCDASRHEYEIEVTLSHQMEDGPEKPIGFMSQALSPAERKSHLDWEGLVVMFGFQKIDKYISG